MPMSNAELAQTLPLLQQQSAGAIVIAWQEFLNQQGHEAGAADGLFGKGVGEATKRYQRAAGQPADGKVGRGTYEQALADGFDVVGIGYGAARADGDRASVLPDPNWDPALEDRLADGAKALARAEQNDGNKRSKGERSVDGIDGIVFHQMSFCRANDCVDRYLGVTAHYIITMTGELAQLHPHDEYLYSSNKLNATTVACEVAGNFRDEKGKVYKPDKFWIGHMSPRQVAAGRKLLKLLQNNQPTPITKVYAHRQADGTDRPNCCGPDIWASIAQWGVDQLGYNRGLAEDYALADGSPIPDSWRNFGLR